MKKIIIAAIAILFACNAAAQIGAPKELTCTERAFNFSVSLGSKLKLGTPKMGPAEIANDDSAYIPGWSFRINHAKSEKPALPLFNTPLRNGVPGAFKQENYVLAPNAYSLKIENKLKNLFPAQPPPGIYGVQPTTF